MFVSDVAAQTSTRTIKDGNRTIIEEKRNGKENTYYYYTVADITERVNIIKKQKKEFNYNAKYTYPIKNNPQQLQRETNSLDSLYVSCMNQNKRNLSHNEIQYFAESLIVDDGSVICYKIRTKIPLLELFTAREILNIFDTVNSFRFTTPLMKYEKTGYLPIDLGYF